MKSTHPTKGTYSFVSLGCPKNLVDSERMLGLLQLDGYELVGSPEGADFVVVNTCGFIERAREESWAAIREMVELKRQRKLRGVIVSGCLVERQKEALLETCPEIDYIVGVFGREEITKIADRFIRDLDEQRAVFRPAPITAFSDRQRLRITPRHFAYLKISEGCDRLCTFCAIPKMRGKHVSKPIEEIEVEARELAENGVRELIIVAQDTTYYGIDLYGRPRLTELLQRLDAIESLDWIRLMYFYPMYIDEPLIETMASARRILPYLDLPLQHINDHMLRRMARRVDRAHTERLLTRLREAIPNLVLRTTFITGFPGETEEQFRELEQFVREFAFERLGVFTYSFEPDTPAAALPDHLPEQVKEERREALMRVQLDISRRWTQAQIGKSLDLIVDQPVAGHRQAWMARSYADAPDVDGIVWLSGPGIRPGDLVRAEIVAAQDYDLIGAKLEPARERKSPVKSGVS